MTNNIVVSIASTPSESTFVSRESNITHTVLLVAGALLCVSSVLSLVHQYQVSKLLNKLSKAVSQ